MLGAAVGEVEDLELAVRVDRGGMEHLGVPERDLAVVLAVYQAEALRNLP